MMYKRLEDMIKPMNILLIEDDEVDVMSLKRAFKKNRINHHVHHAYDGVEALRLLKEIPKPKIILLDLNMPKMSGIEFLTELRKDPVNKDIHVIIMSTSNNELDKKSAYDLHVAGYFLKPVSDDNFDKTINTLANYWNLCVYPE